MVHGTDKLMAKRLIITMGDPAGIGPEIIEKALSAEPTLCEPIIVGGRQYADLAQGKYEFVDVPGSAVNVGEISSAAGQAAYDYVLKAIELFKNGEADAIVTGPLTKASLHKAEIPYRDHTEIFQAHFPGNRQVW